MILAAESQGNALVSFLPLILIAVAFYFFLIRPQKKRQQDQQKMQASLAPGTRIITAGGIYGTVLDNDEGDLLLEIADGVEIRILANAVMKVVEDVELVDEEEVENGESEESAEASGASSVDFDKTEKTADKA